MVFDVFLTAWKVYKYRVFSGPYFPVFSPNAKKYGSEKTPYLDTFYTVFIEMDAQSRKKLMGQSKKIKQKSTRARNFDIYFCVIFGCYD